MEPLNLADVRATHEPASSPYAELLRTESMSLGRYVLPADGTDPQSPHTEDEVYVVLEGRATIRIGEETYPVEPDDVVYVERGVDHAFVDIEERLELLVVFAPPEGSLEG